MYYIPENQSYKIHRAFPGRKCDKKKKYKTKTAKAKERGPLPTKKGSKERSQDPDESYIQTKLLMK